MPFKTTHDLFKITFNAMGSGVDYLIKSRALHKKEGASFASKKEYGEFLSHRNKGILLDGYNKRLTEEMSFRNVAVYGITGTGKSSAFVIPNILDKAKSNNVLIVNDMKGSIFQQTSGHMKRNGYRVIVLNPHDLAHSNRYNPLLDLRGENETVHMAQMFVQAVSSGSKDQIWTAGAERFVTFFLKCLRRRPAEENTLHNLYYLFQNFGEDGRALHRFVADSCIDPVTGDADPFMVNEWKSLLSVHKDGILSFIMNATASLKIFANPDVCKLTARSDIDLGTLRKQKTIIYLTVPPQYQKMYRPVTSMYFLSILQACMERTPNRSDLPVYFLWDEFGNSYLPDFEIFATTVREYRISLMLFMQGINQLETAYGKTISHDILSGVATQISFGSAEQATAEFFSRRAGKIRVIQKPNLKDPHLENYGERNLINPNEVRELGASKALVIAANFKTTLLDFTPSYLHSRFKKYMKTKPTVVQQSGSDRIDFIQL